MNRMKIILKRNLKDYNSWKELVSTNNQIRKDMGSKGMTVHRSAKDLNEVYCVLDWDDQKSYLDYFNMPDVQKALAQSGTTEVIEIKESFDLKA